jgi:hypothetical protein
MAKLALKLRTQLAQIMCDTVSIKAAGESLGTEVPDAPEAFTAAINAAMLDAIEVDSPKRSAAQVELAKAAAEAVEVARWHLDPGAPVTNRNRSGANGRTLAAAWARLEAAAKAAGESLDLTDAMVCQQGKRTAFTKAKAMPKPWQDAAQMLAAADRAVANRVKGAA